MTPAQLNEYLGPGLGFTFTTVALIFVALNAHKTAKLPQGGSQTPPESPESA